MLEVISKKELKEQNRVITIRKMKDVDDIYASITIEQKGGLATKEYILIYDYEKKSIVDGDLIGYGNWFHLEEDELEDWTELVNAEQWI